MKENATTSLLKRSWAALDDPSRTNIRQAVLVGYVAGIIETVASIAILPDLVKLEHLERQYLIASTLLVFLPAVIHLVYLIRAYRPVRDWFLERQRRERPDAAIGWRVVDAIIVLWGIGALSSIPLYIVQIVGYLVVGADASDVVSSLGGILIAVFALRVSCHRYALGEWEA